MPRSHSVSSNSISRDSLLKHIENIAKGKVKVSKDEVNHVSLRLTELRLEYSEIIKITSDYLPALLEHERIYPTILPTQKNARWSYLDPALSNFPKKCINPECPKGHHRKSTKCWSVRDCIIPDENTFWIEHDLDAVEHRIYALMLEWEERITALTQGYEIHTPVTCDLFNLEYPQDKFNPHEAKIDEDWRMRVKWQGKDDTRRTMSKNFTYGGQYFYVQIVHSEYKTRSPYIVYKGLKFNPSFVYSIPNIHSYLIQNEQGQLVPPDFINLAINFVKGNIEIQKRKAEVMAKIMKDKESRTLYGSRRMFYFSNEETAKEGFNGAIQGTVSDYINESAILLQKEFKDSYIVHNQHDSLKWAFRYQSVSQEGRDIEERQILERVKDICQRELGYKSKTMPITATFNIKRRHEHE